MRGWVTTIKWTCLEDVSQSTCEILHVPWPCHIIHQILASEPGLSFIPETICWDIFLFINYPVGTSPSCDYMLPSPCSMNSGLCCYWPGATRNASLRLPKAASTPLQELPPACMATGYLSPQKLLILQSKLLLSQAVVDLSLWAHHI